MNVDNWSASEWERAREGYRYPPVRLVRTDVDRTNNLSLPDMSLAGDMSLIEAGDNHTLEQFHSDLFWSDTPADRLHGLLSVVYWGFYASADPKRPPNPGRAMARARRLVDGMQGHQKPSLEAIHSALETGRVAMRNGRLDDALKAVMSIKYLGMSFASKVLMFLSPSNAAVYDSVIAEKLQVLAEKNGAWGRRVVNVLGSYTPKKGAAYREWCEFCSNKAAELNASGSHWSGANGVRHGWRTVDVERALFALV